jgi:hypothetical protein
MDASSTFSSPFASPLPVFSEIEFQLDLLRMTFAGDVPDSRTAEIEEMLKSAGSN